MSAYRGKSLPWPKLAGPERPPFMDDPRRACSGVDPRVFTEAATIKQIAEAKAYCRRCPVLDACNAWAIDTGQWGVWGATTDKDRDHIRQQRGQQIVNHYGLVDPPEARKVAA